MKKLTIAAVGLVIAAGCSVGALIAVKNSDKKETAASKKTQADYELFSFDYTTMNKITIDCPDGQYTATYADEEWTLDSGEFFLDQTYMQAICSYMSYLTAKDDYGSISSQDLADFGLDDPTVVTVSDGTSSYTVNVGDASPTGEYYYITVGGKDKIYGIEYMYGTVFDVTKAGIKSSKLVPYSNTEISEMIVRKNGEVTCDLIYNTENASWTLPDEYSAFTFDTTKVASLLTTFLNLDAVQMIADSPDNFTKYRFDEPYAELTVKGLDGSEYSMLISKTLEDGNNYYHVLSLSDDQVAVYYQSGLSIIDKTPFDYLLQKITLVNSSELSGFELSFGGNSDVFTVDTENSSLTFNGTSVDISDSDTANSFRNFFESISIVNMSNIDISSDPELTDPALTAVFHKLDGTDLTYQLVTAPDDQYYVFTDGKYTGSLISADKLTGIVSVTTLYDKFLERADLK